MAQMSQRYLEVPVQADKRANRQIAKAVRRVNFEAGLRAHAAVLKLKVQVQAG